MSVFLIIGRALANHRKCGDPVPRGFAIERCIRCAEELSISSGGASTLAAKRVDPATKLAGAICTICALLVARPGSQIDMSANGAAQVENRNDAKVILAALIERASG